MDQQSRARLDDCLLEMWNDMLEHMGFNPYPSGLDYGDKFDRLIREWTSYSFSKVEEFVNFDYGGQVRIYYQEQASLDNNVELAKEYDTALKCVQKGNWPINTEHGERDITNNIMYIDFSGITTVEDMYTRVLSQHRPRAHVRATSVLTWLLTANPFQTPDKTTLGADVEFALFKIYLVGHYSEWEVGKIPDDVLLPDPASLEASRVNGHKTFGFFKIGHRLINILHVLGLDWLTIDENKRRIPPFWTAFLARREQENKPAFISEPPSTAHIFTNQTATLSQAGSQAAVLSQSATSSRAATPTPQQQKPSIQTLSQIPTRVVRQQPASSRQNNDEAEAIEADKGDTLAKLNVNVETLTTNLKAIQTTLQNMNNLAVARDQELDMLKEYVHMPKRANKIDDGNVKDKPLDLEGGDIDIAQTHKRDLVDGRDDHLSKKPRL